LITCKTLLCNLLYFDFFQLIDMKELTVMLSQSYISTDLGGSSN